MKIRDLMNMLALEEDKERQVVFHIWNGQNSLFKPIYPSPNAHANTKNLFVMIEEIGIGLVEPIKNKKRVLKNEKDEKN